jgi:GxxExxY protein
MIDEKYKCSELPGKIVGCAMEVHKTLGSGFQEVISRGHPEIEMRTQGLKYATEFEMPIFCKGENIGLRRGDFFVEDKIKAELKAMIRLEDVHLAQAINYLEVDNMEIGLRINFGSRSCRFKRVMNPRKVISTDNSNEKKS